jgi:hypothetical protein
MMACTIFESSKKSNTNHYPTFTLKVGGPVPLWQNNKDKFFIDINKEAYIYCFQICFESALFYTINQIILQASVNLP